MFFEEYIRREGNTKIGNVIDVYKTTKGSSPSGRELYKMILSQKPSEHQEILNPQAMDLKR